jgi:nicotinamide-nucleotide amidase
VSRRRVALLLVGDELMAGRRQDTNGGWMAGRVAALGAEVVSFGLVGDQVAALVAALRTAASGADVVVVSGGLGPTSDDRTREALAQALGCDLVDDEALWQDLVARLAARGRQPRALHRNQARRPADARALPNPVGTAAGLAAPLGGATVLCLPGVPAELTAMFEAEVVPLLEEGAEAPGARGVLWVAGRPESELAEVLEALPSAAGVVLAWYPHHGEVEVRFEGAGAAEVEAFRGAALGALGSDAYVPAEGERLEHLVIARCRERGWTVATAESISGGRLAERLTAVPGASAVYTTGWITYAAEAKARLLGVPPALIAREGVVSEGVARAMAEGALLAAGTDLAVGTTGVAGPGSLPGPDGRELPVGRIHVALACRTGAGAHVRLDAPPVREVARSHAASAALDLLRRAVS